jgi:hypothetical protein
MKAFLVTAAYILSAVAFAVIAAVVCFAVTLFPKRLF